MESGVVNDRKIGSTLSGHTNTSMNNSRAELRGNSILSSSQAPQSDYFIKLLLIGDTAVGKSSLMSTYATGEFPSKILGTAGIDHKMKNIRLNGKLLKIEIWDTAGQEKFRSLSKKYFEGVSGILLIYDVTDRRSFDSLSKYWLPNIYDNADSNVELALIGNKTDLINERLVAKEEAINLLSTDPNL